MDAKFDVFGKMLTVGECASLMGKRPDQIWFKMRSGMTLTEALFGRINAVAIAQIIAQESPAALPLTASDPPFDREDFERRLSELERQCAELRKALPPMGPT